MTTAKPLDDPHGLQCQVNLADARYGTRVIYATDDFFADKSRLVATAPPVFKPDVYDDNGKWMDGWESRRKRRPGHDYCVIRLGLPGEIAGVDIDTRHFTGNFPPAASLEGCYCAEGEPDEKTVWQPLLAATPLQGDRQHLLPVAATGIISHLRLHIYPDGGVARLRVYGRPAMDWRQVAPGACLDLLAVEHGGRALLCNDQHFGEMGNLINPGRGINMGDGWETARRRSPGNDWVILALGNPGTIRRIEVDTAHFKGNYPDRCSLQAACLAPGEEVELAAQSLHWPELLPPQLLSADNVHQFDEAICDLGVISHVRLNIFPDGGISRLRLYGDIPAVDGE